MTADIVAFVLARAAEREALARAATNDGPWRVDDAAYPEAIYSGDASVVAGGRWGGEGNVFLCDDDARHIAHHDPARVPREVAAVRAIVDAYREVRARRDALQAADARAVEDEDQVIRRRSAAARCDGLEFVVGQLASVDSDHPDYQAEWATE